MAPDRRDGDDDLREDFSADFSDAAATFGDRLGFAREAMGLTEADLAQRMGVKPQTLRDWEEDRAEPRATRLQMLAATLDAPMVWLMSGEGPPRRAADPARRPADAAACLRELRRIRAEQARLVSRLSRVEKRLRAALGGAA